MSWTDKVTIASAVNVAGTEVFSDSVELNSDETAHVQVDVNFDGVPTDDLEVRVYTTLDASTEDWDLTTFATLQTVDKGTDPNRIGFTVTGVYKFRLGFIRSGSTDTHVVTASYRSNGNYRDCSLDI